MSIKTNLKIWTAQMYKAKGKTWPVLDITAKGKDSLGKYFAPKWNIVIDLKNNKISEEEYTVLYHQQMLNSYENHQYKWKELLNKDEVVLICFCKASDFCHRHLLAQYLVNIGATYMGELS